MERKVCVVTGSSAGIGAACARLFASRGWNVVINYSRDAGPAEAMAAECTALGAEVLVVKANVADDADCRALAAAVDAKWGRCDVLVNNAGTTKFVHVKNFDGLDADDFQRIYGVNVVGAFQMVRALTPLLQKNPGSGVVNISSIAASTGLGSCLAYAASKGALNTLTMSLARALGPAVRVNAIAPGYIDTPLLAQMSPAQVATMVAKSPQQRLGTVGEMAETMAWLCSDACSFHTGAVFDLSGGRATY